MGISLNPASLLSGQGLNVSSLVGQLMNQKSGQLTVWQGEQTTLQQQAAVINTINGHLSSLADAVTALSDPLGALTAQTAMSSDTSVVSASAATSAPAGTHTVIVNTLATAGLVYTDAVAGGANVSILPSGQNSGDLKIQIGGASGTSADIQITAGSNDTLNTLATSINSQSTANGWGITASVVTDADGARLSIGSQATGTPGALAIAVNTTSLNFNDPVGGTNASVTIDGTPYHYTTNTVPPGAIPGVTLNLASASPNTPIQITVGPDLQQATAAINTFVSAYNQVINDINQQYTVNPATDSEGPLAPDSALRTLQSSLMAFQNFFQNATSTGFANHFHSDLLNLTDPTVGVLNVDLAQNKTQQQTVADDINNFELRLTAQQAQLTQQLSQVNASLQSYPLLLQQVTETLATMNSSSSSTSGSSSPTLTSGL